MKGEVKTRNYMGLMVKSSFIVFISIFVAKILNYIYKVIIARNFGPEVYGLFSLSLVVLSFFTALSALGLSEGLVRYVSFYRGKRENRKIKLIVGFSFKITLVTSVIAATVMFFSANFVSNTIFNNPSLGIFLRIFSIALPFSVLSGIYLSVLRAFERITSYSLLANVLLSSSKIILLIGFILIGMKSDAVIYSYLISILILFLASYIFGRFSLTRLLVRKYLTGERCGTIKGDLLSYSWPLMFAGIAFNVFYWGDSFLIGYFINVTNVGFYSVAVTLTSLLGIVPDLFVQLFLPLIVREYSSGNIKVIRQLSKQVTKWIFMLNLPIFLAIIFFPGVIINTLFGSKFLYAGDALRILGFGGLIGSFSSTFNSLLSMKGKSRLILGNIIVFAVLNLTFNYILIPKFGIIGAAFATSLSWILLTATQTIQVYKILGFIPFRRKMFLIFVVSIPPIAILMAASTYLPANIWILLISWLIFLIVYGLFMFFSGCLDKYDKFIIRMLKKKFHI